MIQVSYILLTNLRQNFKIKRRSLFESILKGGGFMSNHISNDGPLPGWEMNMTKHNKIIKEKCNGRTNNT